MENIFVKYEKMGIDGNSILEFYYFDKISNEKVSKYLSALKKKFNSKLPDKDELVRILDTGDTSKIDVSGKLGSALSFIALAIQTAKSVKNKDIVEQYALMKKEIENNFRERKEALKKYHFKLELHSYEITDEVLAKLDSAGYVTYATYDNSGDGLDYYDIVGFDTKDDLKKIMRTLGLDSDNLEQEKRIFYYYD